MMKRLAVASLFLALSCVGALAQSCWPDPNGTRANCGQPGMFLNGASQSIPVTSTSPLPVTSQATAPAAGTPGAGYPPGATPITAVFSGADATTAAATLAAAASKITYVCGFNVGGLGATAATTVSPSVGVLVGPNTLTYAGGYTFALGATVADTPFNVTFNPCLPGNAVNTGIAITVPGAAGNTSTTINAWGYQQ